MAVTTRSQIPLRLPKELHADIQQLADEQGVSMNQFLLYVVAGKVSEMKQNREFFEKRTAGRSRKESAAQLKRILDKVPTNATMVPGDELPVFSPE